MRSAGVGVAAALAGAGVVTDAEAAQAKPALWSAEYTAKKGPVSLAMYRRRMGAPKAGDSLPVLFLIHGSSLSGKSTFDLQCSRRRVFDDERLRGLRL